MQRIEYTPIVEEVNNVGEKPQEECAVGAVFSPEGDAVTLAWKIAKELRHRGKQSSGIGVYEQDTRTIDVRRGTGRIASVMSLEEAEIWHPGAEMAILQDRYATSAGDFGQQPVIRDGFALAHNGHFNEKRIDSLVRKFGLNLPGTDTERFAGVLEHRVNEHGGSVSDGLTDILPEMGTFCEGRHEPSAFNLTILSDEGIHAVRDSHAVRPLVQGRIPESGAVIFASEVVGLEAAGAVFEREVPAGTFTRVTHEGEVIEQRWAEEDISSCIFELVYFSKPGNIINGVLVDDYRLRMGEIMSRHVQQAGIELDMWVPVLGSGELYARGAASASGIPYVVALEKNSGEDGERTFIGGESDDGKQAAVRKKFKINPALVKDKSLGVLDDSVVRGNTGPQIVKMLYDAGASEVHMISGSPPYIQPCGLGVNVQNVEELFATGRSNIKMLRAMGSKSLHYPSIQEAYEAAGWKQENTCGGCFGSEYVGATSSLGKLALARSAA